MRPVRPIRVLKNPTRGWCWRCRWCWANNFADSCGAAHDQARRHLDQLHQGWLVA